MVQRGLILLVLIVGFVVFDETRVDAAAPRFILVSGPTTTEPVLLDDWTENLEFQKAIGRELSVELVELEDRPHLEIASFWGDWRHFLEAGGDPEHLKLEDASDHARLYLPDQGRPAVYLANNAGVPRAVDPLAWEILQRHGVMTETPAVDHRHPFGEAWRSVAIVTALGMLVIAVAGIARWRLEGQ